MMAGAQEKSRKNVVAWVKCAAAIRPRVSSVPVPRSLHVGALRSISGVAPELTDFRQGLHGWGIAGPYRRQRSSVLYPEHGEEASSEQVSSHACSASIVLMQEHFTFGQ